MREFFTVDTMRPRTIKKIVRASATLVVTYYFILLLNYFGFIGTELLWYAYNSSYLFALVTTILTLFSFSSKDKKLVAVSVIIFFIGMAAYIFLSPALNPSRYVVM